MVRWATLVSGCVLVLSIAVTVQMRSVLGQDEVSSAQAASVEENWFEEDADDPLESERQLKRMINLVTPLMEIFHLGSPSRWTRSSEDEARKMRPASYQVAPAKSSFGDYGSASSYGGGGGYGGSCCGGNNDLLPILAIVALSLLLLYLITVATTTTSRTGKKRRAVEDNNLDDDIGRVWAGASYGAKQCVNRRHGTGYIEPGATDGLRGTTFLKIKIIFHFHFLLTELLDAPAWLSMVQDLWEHDAEMADKSLSCAQRTLCRMNRVARSSPTKASWAVSISR